MNLMHLVCHLCVDGLPREIPADVSVVFIEIGSNDLTNERLSVDDFVQQLTTYVNHILTSSPNVVHVKVLEILRRQQPRSSRRRPFRMTMNTYNGRVDDANRRLSEWSTLRGYFTFCRHDTEVRCQRPVAADGVHLTPLGVHKYWMKVRGAALRSVRGLPTRHLWSSSSSRCHSYKRRFAS